jgi:hypothetical protein
VILEPVFNRQPSHADVEARLRGIPVWIAPSLGLIPRPPSGSPLTLMRTAERS